LVDLARVGFVADTGPLKSATNDVQDFGNKSEKAAGQVDKANASFEKAKTSTAGVADSYKQAGIGASGFSDAANKVVTSLDQQIAKTQLTSAELRVLQALQKSGLTLETQSGQAIAQKALVLDQVLTKTKASTVGTNELGVALAALFPNLTKTATETDHAASAHGGLSAQSQAAAHAVRSMGESLALGISPTQALTQQINHLSFAASGEGGLSGAFGGIARILGPGGLIGGGIAAATIAFLGIDFIMSKSSQEADDLRKRLEALAGVKLGDQYNNSLKQLSSELGVSTKAAAPAFEALSKIVSLKAAPGGVQILGGTEEFLNRTTISADNLKASIEGIFTSLRLGRASTGEATDATNKFFIDLQKNGKLTGTILRDLQSASPAAAAELTKLMTGGKLNTEQFIASLDKIPASLQQTLEWLPKLSSANKAAFDEMQKNPKTVGEAVDKLQLSFSKLSDTISGSDKPRVSIIAQAFSGLANSIEEATPAIKRQVDQQVNDLNDIDRQVEKSLATIRLFKDDGITSITAWANAAISEFQRVASGAVSAANTIENALSGIAKGGGGNSSGLSGGGNPGTTDALGNVNGGTGGGGPFDNGSGTGGNAGTINLGDLGGGTGDITNDLPAFATGGSFQVGGSGGTDSQLVQFKASPWETVTISGGEGQSGGAVSNVGGTTSNASQVSDAPVQSIFQKLSESIAQNLATQTKSLSAIIDGDTATIVGAITNQTVNLENFWTTELDKLSTAVNTSGNNSTSAIANVATANATTALANTALGTTGSFSPGAFGASPLGAGGFNTQKDPNDTTKSSSSSSSNQQQQQSFATGSPFGLVQGQGSTISGAFTKKAENNTEGNPDVSHPLFSEDSLPGEPGSPFEGPVAPLPGQSGSPFEGPIDAGFFADGGSFKIPGAGGVDNQLVTLHGRPGETVTVTRPGESGSDRHFNITVNVQATDISSIVKSQPQLANEILRAVKLAEASL
jgi:hypothetical protein